MKKEDTEMMLKIFETDVDYRITCNNGNQRTLIKP